MTLETRAPDRQVPFDEAAEQQVIGSLLIDRDAIFKVADLLRVDDFYVPRHQRIYDAAQALLDTTPRPTEEQIREAIGGNLCRCTGYQQIVDAVKHAAERLAGKKD